MYSNIFLMVEIRLGTSIESAASECLQLASRIDVPVKFKFNGVTLVAYPLPRTRLEAGILELKAEYERKLK